MPTSEASLTNGRSTKADIAALDDALYAIVAAHQPLTVRNAFYMAAMSGLAPKTDSYAGYGRVQRRLLVMRRAKRIPYGWITDESRYVIRVAAATSMDDFLREQARLYRLDLWAHARVRVQVWCEKLSIAGVMDDITDELCVPLYPARGFASEAFMVSAAEEIADIWRRREQRTALLYFGDHDPSGARIDPAILRRIRELLADMGVAPALEDFRRVAVTREQIAAWGLPTRPTKRRGNAHAKRFAGGSVEIDAVPPTTLRAVEREAILGYADARQMRLLATIEAQERRYLEIFAGQASPSGNGDGLALWSASQKMRAASMCELLALIAKGRLADGTRTWGEVVDSAAELAGVPASEVVAAYQRHHDARRPHLAVRRTAAWLLERLQPVTMQPVTTDEKGKHHEYRHN